MIMRTARPRRPGSVAVETAVVLPIALLFLFGILEYGRMLFFFHLAQNAVVSGARFAVVRTGDSAVTEASIQDETDRNLIGTGPYLLGYNKTSSIHAKNVNPATLATVSGNWNDAPFSGAIMVELTGSYQIITWKLLQYSGSGLPVAFRSIMSSEAN